MNFFKTLFASKLDALKAAAPRATLRMSHESDGFSLYMGEAVEARKLSQLGTLTDHAEDVLEDSVPVLFVPLEQMMKFVEEVTAHHSVAFVDVVLANRVNNARHTMYAYFPKRAVVPVATLRGFGEEHRLERLEFKKESSDDFWG